MATILFVHGSWHGGWVWNDLRSSLVSHVSKSRLSRLC